MKLHESMLALALASSLTACGGGGSSGDSATGSGQFTLNLTDAPVESAEKVVVEFSQVILKQANGEDVTYDLHATATGCEVLDPGTDPGQPCSLDLLDLTNGRSVVLINEEIPAGTYTQIRLGVGTANYIVLEENGEQHELSIPSGEQTGLKLVRNFTVGSTAATAFTIDFDVRKSLVKQGNGQYKLKPTLRIVETAAAATVTGTVDKTTVTELCGTTGTDLINGPAGSVYVFSDLGVTPDDLDGTAPEAVTTASVYYSAETDAYPFTAAFLPAGSYTLAYTCGADDPEQDDNLVFSATGEITLGAGQTATVDL